jgi:glycosyltransferase involved in cell wall biosynthesis
MVATLPIGNEEVAGQSDANPPQGLRILWLKTGPLHPIDSGGKIRTYQLLKELKKRHRVTYLALCPDSTPDSIRESASEYSHEQVWIPWTEPAKAGLSLSLQAVRNLAFSKLPFVIDKYRSTAMEDAIQRLEESGKIDVILCDFLTPSINLPPPTDAPQTRALLFQHNVESMIWKRTAEQSSHPAKRAYFASQWRRMIAYEKQACARFDGILSVSDEDTRLMREELGLQNVLGSVPTGVDTDYFTPAPDTARRPLSLVFLGSMDWMPNIDGAICFMEEIFPTLKAKFPALSIKIVGRNPALAIRDLAARHPEVTVTGTVPDVRPHLETAQVMIVPLRVGGGTRIKIFEAMATGIPTVSTSIGAEGLPVEHNRHLLLADTPRDFTGAVSQLFDDAPLRQRLANEALTLVRDHYGWPSVADVFERMLRPSPAPVAVSYANA